MTQFAAYLAFDGTCAEAFKFYERTLGGKLQMLMKIGDSPMGKDVPEKERERIMHAALTYEGGMLMGADAPANIPFDGMKGFCISIEFPTAEKGKQIFDTLAEGGSVQMPWGEQFWVETFGMCTDRFGTPWMVNAGKNKL